MYLAAAQTQTQSSVSDTVNNALQSVPKPPEYLRSLVVYGSAALLLYNIARALRGQ